MPSLNTLDPGFRSDAKKFYAHARKRDPRFTVTSALRTTQDQQRLYAAYKKGLSPYPAAVPGTSYHELGLAWDMVRLGIEPREDPLLAELGREWRQLGGVWGGAVDPVHFQVGKSYEPSSPERAKAPRARRRRKPRSRAQPRARRRARARPRKRARKRSRK